MFRKIIHKIRYFFSKVYREKYDREQFVIKLKDKLKKELMTTLSRQIGVDYDWFAKQYGSKFTVYIDSYKDLTFELSNPVQGRKSTFVSAVDFIVDKMDNFEKIKTTYSQFSGSTYIILKYIQE